MVKVSRKLNSLDVDLDIGVIHVKTEKGDMFYRPWVEIELLTGQACNTVHWTASTNGQDIYCLCCSCSELKK